MTVALRVLLMGAMITGFASAAAAEWTKAQRTGFLDSCVEACRATPNISAQARVACPKACECMADEGSKFMTPDDMAAMDEAAAAGKTTEKTEQLTALYPVCVRRAVGE